MKVFVALQFVHAGFRDDPENNNDKNCPVGMVNIFLHLYDLYMNIIELLTCRIMTMTGFIRRMLSKSFLL